MDERECTVCEEPIDELASGSAMEEAAYAAELCVGDFDDENPDWSDPWME